MLNKTKGNMYNWCTHTWNTVKGACPHSCEYCYMKKWGKQPDLHFDQTELKTDLGSGNFIFVGSSCDMWARIIILEWISDTLEHCKKFNNRYLYQSKNPARIYAFHDQLPANSVLGTTIETNREYPEMGSAPGVDERAWGLLMLNTYGYETMVTIEPIMDFDLQRLFEIIKVCQPRWVNIGANTRNTGKNKVTLPEPPPEKVKDLITALKGITEVRIKPNLKRLTS